MFFAFGSLPAIFGSGSRGGLLLELVLVVAFATSGSGLLCLTSALTFQCVCLLFGSLLAIVGSGWLTPF